MAVKAITMEGQQQEPQERQGKETLAVIVAVPEIIPLAVAVEQTVQEKMALITYQVVQEVQDIPATSQVQL